MEKKAIETKRVFYMYYTWNGKQERSQEFNSFAEFYEKCGKWCNEHPLDWRLCYRDVRSEVK